MGQAIDETEQVCQKILSMVSTVVLAACYKNSIKMLASAAKDKLAGFGPEHTVDFWRRQAAGQLAELQRRANGGAHG